MLLQIITCAAHGPLSSLPLLPGACEWFWVFDKLNLAYWCKRAFHSQQRQRHTRSLALVSGTVKIRKDLTTLLWVNPWASVSSFKGYRGTITGMKKQFTLCLLIKKDVFEKRTLILQTKLSIFFFYKKGKYAFYDFMTLCLFFTPLNQIYIFRTALLHILKDNTIIKKPTVSFNQNKQKLLQGCALFISGGFLFHSSTCYIFLTKLQRNVTNITLNPQNAVRKDFKYFYITNASTTLFCGLCNSLQSNDK